MRPATRVSASHYTIRSFAVTLTSLTSLTFQIFITHDSLSCLRRTPARIPLRLIWQRARRTAKKFCAKFEHSLKSVIDGVGIERVAHNPPSCLSVTVFSPPSGTCRRPSAAVTRQTPSPAYSL